MGKTVAVIGAGHAGLSTIRHLTASPAVGKVVGFERYGEVGGLWVYTDKTGTDVDGLPVHSTIYKDMRTNFPKGLMTFPDFPFPRARPSFPQHREVKDYIQAYAKHFNMIEHIRLNTTVTRVEPLSPGGRDTRWAVTYCTFAQPETSATEEFDVVVVCNGHSVEPIEPEIQGREIFQGTIIHSRDYRVTDPFQDQVVMLVGAGPSAADIAPILSRKTKKIIISKDKTSTSLSFQIPEKTSIKSLVHYLTETSVVFDNGEEEQVDAIILCTGYRYSFPFLTEACGIVLQDEGRIVSPLYKQMISTTYPTLMFVGVPAHCVNFTVYDRQARFVAKVIEGAVELPTKAEMDRDTEKDFEERITAKGLKPGMFHKIMLYSADYCNSLSEMANTPKFPENEHSLLMYLAEFYQAETLTFKDAEFDMLNDSFRRIDTSDKKTQAD